MQSCTCVKEERENGVTWNGNNDRKSLLVKLETVTSCVILKDMLFTKCYINIQNLYLEGVLKNHSVN